MLQTRRLTGLVALAGAMLGGLATIHISLDRADAADPWEMVSHRAEWRVEPGRPEADGARAQSVFGPDDRLEVEDTTEWPFRLVSHLILFDEDANPIAECSGMVLSPNSVLTAAHCVFDYETQTFHSGVLVVPGEDPLSEPYGLGIVVDVAVPNGWADTGDHKYDVAVVRVQGAEFLPQGPYAIVAGAPNSYLFDGNTVLFSAGYPGDKPFGSQWITAAAVEEVDFDFIYTSMDAFPGQSGSPIFTYNFQTETAYVVGVFSFETPFFNGAVRFNPTVIEALQAYCQSLGCSFETVMLAGPAPETATPTATATPTMTPTPANTPGPGPSPSPTTTQPPGPSLQFKLRTQQLARDGLN